MNTHYVGGTMKKIFISYAIDNLREITIITLIMFIGLIIGVIYINNMSNENRSNVKNHINELLDYVEESNDENKVVDSFEILKSNLKRNLIFILLLGLFSSCLIGIPIMYVMILGKTFSLGYTMSAVIASIGTKGGIIFICSSMVLHNIIFLIGIYLVSISGKNLYKEVLGERRENIKYNILKHMIFIIIGLAFAIIAALIETFISNSLFLMCKKYI